MAEVRPTPAPADDAAHGHGDIHMPPNSFVPVSLALSLCTTFVGFIDQVRSALGPTVWLIGLLWLIATCATWFLAARSEYRELPETLDGH